MTLKLYAFGLLHGTLKYPSEWLYLDLSEGFISRWAALTSLSQAEKYQIYFYVMLSIFVDKNKATNNFSFI